MKKSTSASCEVRAHTGPAEVGVGPWPGEWPEGSQYDAELLRDGDRRNVVDRYRYWSMEAIVADLDARRHDFHVAIENWQHDFNIGTIVRTANAFLAAEVHIVGNRRWNRRGAMVTDRYQHIRHHADVPALARYLHELPSGPVRLLGIDCPESSRNSKCRRGGEAACKAEVKLGKAATRRAKELAPERAEVTIEAHGHDRYGRTLAYVMLPDGRDLGLTLLREGVCADWSTRYPHPRSATYKAAK